MPSDYLERRDAMMNAIEIVSAVAAVITIFSAGVAVGRFLPRHSKNDHQ